MHLRLTEKNIPKIDPPKQGRIEVAERLYESPFTDANPSGVAGLFPPADVADLIQLIRTTSLAAA